MKLVEKFVTTLGKPGLDFFKKGFVTQKKFVNFVDRHFWKNVKCFCKECKNLINTW